jgi:predicted nucleic acid-binding protein
MSVTSFMIAIDTNVLLYSVDAEQPEKMAIANSLLRTVDRSKTILPWQVLCEFSGNLYRKRARNRLRLEVDLLDVLQAWMQLFKVVHPPDSVIERAWWMTEKYQMSYWDAQLIAACAEAGVDTLYTEDMQSRPEVEGVKLINPFKP